MLVGIQQHPSLSAQTYFNYETFLVQCFSTVFGIRPIFEMHRGMWPGYTFSRFHERFWQLAHFRNTQRHVARLFIFLLSSAFLAFCPFWKHTEACGGQVIHFLVFMSVFGSWPIFEIHRGMWPGYSFFRFQVRFWHFAHFGNTQRHVVRSYIFSFS